MGKISLVVLPYHSDQLNYKARSGRKCGKIAQNWLVYRSPESFSVSVSEGRRKWRY